MNAYDRLVALARSEAGLIAAGDFDALEQLNLDRDALVASLPAAPSPHARPALVQAAHLVALNTAALTAAVEQSGGDLSRLGTNRRVAVAYSTAGLL